MTKRALFAATTGILVSVALYVFPWSKPVVQFHLEPVLSMEFPALASTKVAMDENDASSLETRYCGAMVISSNVLIASAHCQGYFLSHGVDIPGDEVTTHHSVTREVVHPEYTTTSAASSYDIMLVQLASTTTVEPVTLLHDATRPNVGDSVSILGWQSNLIMKLTTATSRCRNNGDSKNQSLSPTTSFDDDTTAFCTTSDVCNVVAGGPVLMDNVLVGLFSHCNDNDDFADQNRAVYTRTNALADFIHTNACTLSRVPPPRWCTSSGNDQDEMEDFATLLDSVSRSSSTVERSLAATDEPSEQPSENPSARPSAAPSSTPSHAPTVTPSSTPSQSPSVSHAPSAHPSVTPSSQPSAHPSIVPTARPSGIPSKAPSTTPSLAPSTAPSKSAEPSAVPSTKPSTRPSAPTSVGGAV
jgi:Trypsin